jgi:hypothetical protein
MALMAGAFRLMTWNGLTPLEWTAAGLAVLGGVIGLATRATGTVVPLVLTAGVLLQLVYVPAAPHLHLLGNPPEYRAAEPALRTIAPTIGPDDRVHLVHEHPQAIGYRLMPKTASLFRLRAITDYEPLVSRRYAELFMMMRSGRPLRGLNEFLYGPARPLSEMNRRLLDLVAVRYVVATAPYVADAEHVRPPLQQVTSANGITILENLQRLPRAHVVSRIEIIPDAPALLTRLANGSDDLRRVVFLEEPPASGFVGSAAPAESGTVRFTRDDPEHVRLDVQSSTGGFVVLTDQYFPGWIATVGGASAPILRANYAFRAVEVPAGHSVVEFRYAPRSLRIGALVSVASVLLCVALVVRRPNY